MKLWIGALSICLVSAGLATADEAVQERFRYAADLVRYIPGEATWVLRPGPAEVAALHAASALPRLSVRLPGPANTAGVGTGTIDAAVAAPKDPHGAALPLKQSCLGDLPQ